MLQWVKGFLQEGVWLMSWFQWNILSAGEGKLWSECF